MYKIIIKGEAKTDYPNLKTLDGIDCQDEFTEYFDDNFTFKDSVTNGYLRFKFENNKLWAITEYDSDRELTPEELDGLADYTQGQWSDGIGEGFEQNPCMYDEDENEVCISPWYFGQKLIVTQEKVK